MVVEQGKSEQAPNWAIHQKRGGNIHCTNKKDWEKAPEQQDNTKEWKTLGNERERKGRYRVNAVVRGSRGEQNWNSLWIRAENNNNVPVEGTTVEGWPGIYGELWRDLIGSYKWRYIIWMIWIGRMSTRRSTSIGMTHARRLPTENKALNGDIPGFSIDIEAGLSGIHCSSYLWKRVITTYRDSHYSHCNDVFASRPCGSCYCSDTRRCLLLMSTYHIRFLISMFVLLIVIVGVSIIRVIFVVHVVLFGRQMREGHGYRGRLLFWRLRGLHSCRRRSNDGARGLSGISTGRRKRIVLSVSCVFVSCCY